jgi:DNA-binding MarR family transcriptional regulator
MDTNYDILKLENQLCFPLYASAKEVVRKYKPLLDPLGLTYTQYIVMMVLWEKKTISIKELGKTLYLDSGTLTPLLKRLEKQHYIERIRDSNDERNVNIILTAEGVLLKTKALPIPRTVGSCIPLSIEEAQTLFTLLHKLLKQL